MSNPRLRIRASNFGGSGYVRAAIGAVPAKVVTNSDGDKLKALADSDGNAIKYIGVTTALRQLDKPAIPQWKADCVASFAVTHIDDLLNRSELEGYNFLRFRSDDVLNDAAEQGTWIHEYAAATQGFGFYPEAETRNHEQMAAAWEQFCFDHDVRNVRWAERTMGNLEHSYLGTADLLADVDDLDDCLIDLKSARSTWPDHWAQLAALTECEFETYELGGDGTNTWYEGSIQRPKNAALIHIRPQDGPKEPFCKLLPMHPEKHDVYFKLFLASLQAAYARRELTLLEKELGK